ncbi:HAD family hydrolase [Thermodesulfobacteriota bacterium]
MVIDYSKGAICVVLLDFGGVMAEEGFREGLMAIARSNGISADKFFEFAAQSVYGSGYVVGGCTEAEYWARLREQAGIRGEDEKLRQELLDRFILRPWAVELVRKMRRKGTVVALLSDQTNWLDELNERDDFCKEFDHVFNSYHLGKGKRDPSLFDDVAELLAVEPSRAVFVDDSPDHIERARSRGFNAILYRDKEDLLAELRKLGLAL